MAQLWHCAGVAVRVLHSDRRGLGLAGKVLCCCHSLCCEHYDATNMWEVAVEMRAETRVKSSCKVVVVVLVDFN